MIDLRTSNAELVRRGYEAFARGDLATVETTFASDAVWHTLHRGRLGGRHEGWPEILRFFAETMEIMGGSFRAELLEVLANDESVAAIVRQTAHSARGGSLDDREVHLFRISDGKATEVWQQPEDAVAAEAFWSA